jgi:hypothetical protein
MRETVAHRRSGVKESDHPSAPTDSCHVQELGRVLGVIGPVAVLAASSSCCAALGQSRFVARPLRRAV